ncbi:MAG: hypothetical protein ACYCZ1_06215 [Candidatus Humimicrobiaceae bacterium]
MLRVLQGGYHLPMPWHEQHAQPEVMLYIHWMRDSRQRVLKYVKNIEAHFRIL